MSDDMSEDVRYEACGDPACEYAAIPSHFHGDGQIAQPVAYPDFVAGMKQAERRHNRRVCWGRVLHLARWHGWCLPRRCKVAARQCNAADAHARAEQFGSNGQANDN